MKKFSVVFILFSMLLHIISLPLHTYAQENYYNMKNENGETDFIDGKIITDKDEEKVPLYESMNHDSEVLAHLYNGDTLKVIENYEEFSLVEIDLKDKNKIDINVNNNDDDGNSEILQGYIVNNYIDLNKDEKTEKDKESNSTIEDDDDEKNNDKENTNDNNNIENNENETDNKSNSKSKSQEPPAKNKSGDKNNNDLNNNTDNTETDSPEKGQFKKVDSKKGIAQKSPTNVREEPSTKTNVIKTIPIGSVIEYKPINDNWYEISVDVNGKQQNGYIHKKHVENIDSEQKNIEGITQKSPTNVRDRASTKSSVIKTIPIDSIIDFKSFSNYWYEITVEVNGKQQTGYIHRKHVKENDDNNIKSIKGIAQKSPTNVRDRASTKSNVIKTIPIGSVIEYKPFNDFWYKISVKVNGENQIGYIHKKHVENIDSEQKNIEGITQKSPTNVRDRASTKSNVIKTIPVDSVIKFKSFSNYWYEITVDVNGKQQTGYIHKKHVEKNNDTNEDTNIKSVKGIAQKSPTNIREEPSTKANVVKTIPIGSVIEYKPFNDFWYEISVKVNGKNQIGYIHKKHTENLDDNQSSFKAVTSKSPTNVRDRASTKANVLTKIENGKIIDLKTFSKHWYEITVTINGKKENGYIHKKHVEKADNKIFQGVALKDKTRIRTETSTTSKKLTTVPKGTVLNYKLHNQNWYKVIIKLDGTEKTGFIHTKHIEEGIINQETVWGLTLKEPTNLRSGASTKSDVLTTFSMDSIIEMRTFSKNWYQVETIINNEKQTGYIHKKHVKNVNNKTFKGTAKKKNTRIRTEPSTTSEAAVIVPKGFIIEYKPFNQNWYKAIITKSGVKKTGYIHKKHIEESIISQENVKGIAQKNPTNVRIYPSTKADILTTFNIGEILNYKTFSEHWYEIETKVNGKTKIGYIHKKHVGSDAIKKTKYNLSLNQVLDIQLSKNPVTSGYASMYVHKDGLKKNNGKWVVNGTNWNVRSKPNSSSKILGKIDKRYTESTITVDEKNSTKNYYKFKTAWILANKNDLKKHIDPRNFSEGSDEFYQFLVLSQPAGTNEQNVNKKILNEKAGILEDQASSYIRAAEKYNINELYLISHSLLETGNGTSKLAKGIKVGKNKSGNPTIVNSSNKANLTNIKTVYNMYGIGAVDKNPNKYGAIRAYEEGWTTKHKAIVNGAKFVAEDYIYSGQDTLYKMRWNPEAMEKGTSPHQYATDIGWAKKQTKNLASYYKLLDEYSLIFDVPVYK